MGPQDSPGLLCVLLGCGYSCLQLHQIVGVETRADAVVDALPLSQNSSQVADCPATRREININGTWTFRVKNLFSNKKKKACDESFTPVHFLSGVPTSVERNKG